mmetsp:Transcript_14388/g.42315  ORF Transcript_14388/g.42315 Transcript_14388/m.42315 type:complete len:200 (+) Transcript_14388:746-1345(+)
MRLPSASIPAVPWDLTKCLPPSRLAVAMISSVSASLSSESNTTTHGAGGRDTTRGPREAKAGSVSMRWKRASRSPGPSAGTRSGSRRHRVSKFANSHVSQESAQCTFMYRAFFSHSPEEAHNGHSAALSLHFGCANWRAARASASGPANISPPAPPTSAPAAFAAPVVGHVLQLRAHCTDINSSFRMHSPICAQPEQSP